MAVSPVGTGQKLVDNAVLIRLVNPEITESPVTIRYRTAAKAAATTVPTAYSTVLIPASC